MPRRKTKEAPPEVIEETEQPKIVREVKHKTEWVELQPVESEQDESQDSEFYEEIDIDGNTKPKKKNERDELRKVLAKNNVTPGSNLRLSIERYLHSETAEGGNWAETEFLTKYVCTKEHLTNEDFLDVARKWGPGTYRFTLRMNHAIVSAWDRRIGSVSANNTGDSALPISALPIFTSVPEGGGQQQAGQQLSLQDLIKLQDSLLERRLKEIKMFRDILGPNEPPSAPVTDPEIAAMTMIAKNPEVMEKVGAGFAKSFFGGKADSDPWADVAMEALRSGQAVAIVREGISAIFNGLGTLFPKNNGQTQMVPQPQMAQAPQVQVPTQPITGPQLRGPIPSSPEGPPNTEVVSDSIGSQAAPIQEVAIQQEVTPADVLVVQLIQAMERQASVEEGQAIIDRECMRNPELNESVDDLLGLPIDRIMPVLQVYHPKVQEIPHAKEWLQKLLNALDMVEK